MADAATVHTNHAMHFLQSLTLASSTPANDDKPRVVGPFKWIHCANEGMYKGHHQGQFDLTRAVFEGFVKNFRDHPQYRAGNIEHEGKTYTGGTRQVIQFDYEHASEMPPWEGTIPANGAPAPAWVLDVELRDGPDGKAQLWAFGKLGSQIRGQIEREEILFVSIAFTLKGIHWITGAPIGPVLTSIAFTNHPFMQDLEPLAAANRQTSAPLGGRVKPPGELSEAPGTSTSQATGDQTMSDQFRERICSVLSLRTTLDDKSIGDAVEEAASTKGNLASILDAIGVKNSGEAMKAIPELISARDTLAGYVAEINELLKQEAVADAGIAKVDIGAAMKAQGYQGEGASKALGAFRTQCISEEVAKLTKGATPAEPVKLSALRSARELGRQRFLNEYGVKDIENAHLSTSIIATRGGNQLEAPTTAPRPLTITDRADGAQAVDLRGVKGRNTTEKLITHLSKAEPGFSNLSYARQIERTSEFRKTTPLQLA